MFTTTTMARQNDFSRKFTEEDGFQVAFAVVDYASADYSDAKGRQLSDYLNVWIWLEEFNEDLPNGEKN